ncbi:MAG: GNAT family N-acetyltransferase [Thomasclavelia sp.]|nr:GNAT family N-acetyltransferase [Thomasclavelia sp.]
MIETKRLIIRELKKEDALRFSEYRNKPEVSKYQSWNHYPVLKAKWRIRYTSEHPLKNEIGNYQLGIYLKDSDLLIGDIFVQIEKENSFSIGYTLDNDYWHQGYAFEAISVFLSYMHDVLSLNKCVAHVYQANVASIMLLKKLGFYEKTRSQQFQDIYFIKEL